jgi:hypothetical protein
MDGEQCASLPFTMVIRRLRFDPLANRGGHYWIVVYDMVRQVHKVLLPRGADLHAAMRQTVSR